MRPTGRSASTTDPPRSTRWCDAPPVQRTTRRAPFLESYRVVAEALLRWEPRSPGEGQLMARALKLGKQRLLQQRIRGAESVSRSYFETALRLADNRKLLGAGADGLEERRRQSRRRAVECHPPHRRNRRTRGGATIRDRD